MKRVVMLLSLIAAALFTALVVAGCGGAGGGEITVKGTEYKFDPASVTLQAGQKAKVTLQNDGAIAHNWTVLGLDNVTTGDVESRQKKSVEFTPPQAGTYTVECTIPGHAEAGMTGTLTVQ